MRHYHHKCKIFSFDRLYITYLQVYSNQGRADHSIMVDGKKILTNQETGQVGESIAASTSFVYYLQSGQTVSVDPGSNDVIHGFSDFMTTWFGMTLLHAD